MTEQKLKVWWIPQLPGAAFETEVIDIEQAKKILRVLASYDLFQLNNNIKGDYCNAGGLMMLDDDGDWTDWYDDDGNDIDDLMRMDRDD